MLVGTVTLKVSAPDYVGKADSVEDSRRLRWLEVQITKLSQKFVEEFDDTKLNIDCKLGE